MQNLVWAIETGWFWYGGSTTSADSWIDICGDGESAAAKDDTTVVKIIFNNKIYSINTQSSI